MRRILPALLLAVVLVPVSARAQPSIDLDKLPAEIKALQWQGVDFESLPPLQQCQSLLLMNQVLEELGAQLLAEADMMSSYIDTKGMGPAFASQAPVADSPSLTFADAEKIAAALLQGPMADSTYASQLSGSSADVLTAYEHLYTSTCQSKWSAMSNNQLRVRAMSRFLQAKGQMADYQAWLPGEQQRQAQNHQQQLAAKQQADEAEQSQQGKQMEEKLQQQNQQMQQAEAKEQATQSMHQAMAYAQQQQQQQDQSGGVVVPSYGYPTYYYGGWGAVAHADWYRDAAYRGAAEARTDARMSAWHGADVRR